MELADIRDYLKTLDAAEYYNIGRLNNKKEKSLGVYSRTRSGPPVHAIGQPSSYDIKAVTLLLHWNQDARETEQAALTLWNKLLEAEQITIGGTPVYYLQMQVPEPVAVGTDDNGVYEYVIDFNLYFRR